MWQDAQKVSWSRWLLGHAIHHDCRRSIISKLLLPLDPKSSRFLFPATRLLNS